MAGQDASTMTLATVYAGWDHFQDEIIESVKDLTDEQLDLRAAPHLRTLRDLLAHLARVRVSWFHLLLGQGGAEYDAMLTWDHPDQPKRSASELVGGLKQSWTLVSESLAGWTVADLPYVYEGERHGTPYSLTRQWVIAHVLEHDHTHGGELFLTLGMHGLPAPDW